MHASQIITDSIRDRLFVIQYLASLKDNEVTDFIDEVREVRSEAKQLNINTKRIIIEDWSLTHKHNWNYDISNLEPVIDTKLEAQLKIQIKDSPYRYEADIINPKWVKINEQDNTDSLPPFSI